MKVPVDWLREYVTYEGSIADLVQRLTISSCNVQHVYRRGVADEDGNLGLFRVGKVVEAGKHPNADRLQLCRVDVGEAEPRQIVCGAWNFGAGATVAVALPGAVLPGGQKLEQAKLRGTVSDGMILSERELELGDDHAGIMVLADSAEPGTPLADVLPLGEDVIEVETTPNRPDLLSVYGIAREVAALFDLTLAPMPGTDPAQDADEPVDIKVEDFEGCPRYVGRAFTGVRIGPSPAWLKARLKAAGMRPISNVVDVTNYVMHGLGNPLHAFDHAKLAGGRIVVRRARKGEELTTLDGNLRKLDERDLVIADGERAVAVAGIMGGAETEVTDETTNVLLEAANFEPIGLLRTSERLGLRTEGSNRWEKGVDPYLARPAATLATQLIVELAGARWVGHADVHAGLPERAVIQLRPGRADHLIGLATPPDDQRAILERFGFDVEASDTVLQATVPTWRARDVTREVDVVEEVARFRLDEVPYTLPARREMFGRLSQQQRLRRLVEDALVGAGFFEAYTPSLGAQDEDERALRIPQPQSSDQAVLRTRILPGLIEAARHNLAVGNSGIALFEIARVYLPSQEQLPEERWRLAGIAEGGFAEAKGAVEALHAALRLDPRFERTTQSLYHPGKAASFASGVVGELEPGRLEGDWGAFEIDLETLFAEVADRREYEDVITFPPLRLDLALVVDEAVPAGELIDAARAAAGDALRGARVFDVYRGDQVAAGRKSVAIAFEFGSLERTLTDEDGARLRDTIAAALQKQFGAELRAG
jgi:phenylalanyl-tRNA synthetase beta chain